MMIIGLGVDIVELDRISRAWQRFGQTFARRILGSKELSELPARPIAFLAARFAAKEAAAKALGTGFTQQVHFHDLQITLDDLGKPKLMLSDGAQIRAITLGIMRAHVSLSHSRDAAVAVVILES